MQYAAFDDTCFPVLLDCHVFPTCIFIISALKSGPLPVGGDDPTPTPPPTPLATGLHNLL